MTIANHAFNAVNRGVYIADNLNFLRSLNSETIDLVCIDPPFAKNETFGRQSPRAADPLNPPLTEEERDNELRLMASWGINNEGEADDAGINWPETRYKDFWSWEKDIHEEWLIELGEYREPISPIVQFIEATRESHSDETAAYLCYMAVRLLEIHRVLKREGSLYLHCDHTVGPYLRALLDTIFGNGENATAGFRTEITWRRANAKGHAFKSYANNSDKILYYSKGENFTWNPQFEDHDPSYIDKAYRYIEEETGRRYRLGDLTNPNRNRPNLTYEFLGVTRVWRWTKDRMQEAYEQGLVVQTRPGGVPAQKRYLDEMQGNAVDTIWEDINPLQPNSTERTGCPTQKPVALAERIIAASSKPNEVVLDCFAGCAYTAIAAERLQRKWIACDINPRAWTVFKRQFNKPGLALLTCHDMTTGQQVLADNPTVTIHGPNQLPLRTSPEQGQLVRDLPLKERKFKVPASIIPEPDMLEKLLDLSGYTAWCCGFANRRPDGTIIRSTRNSHLDHLAPKSREGTSNEIQNRAPMCPYHNIRKNNRQIALSQYRQEIADAGEMMLNSAGDLINLNYALNEAMKMYGRAFAAKHE